MPDSESFDAFYARTVWSVTSQMHELAGADSAADHAIREAYARAYQQWFEVSGYGDSEGWVLGVAKDAYQRRLSEAVADGRDAWVAQPHDPGTWPGIYRPRAAQGQPTADPQATVAPQGGGAQSGTAHGDVTHGDPALAEQADGGQLAGGTRRGEGARGGATGAATVGAVFGSAVPPGRLPDGEDPASEFPGGAMPAGAGPGSATPGGATTTAYVPGQSISSGPMASRSGLATRLGSRRVLVAALVAVIVASGAAYFAFGQHKAPPAASPASPPGTHAKPAEHMLSAGQQGTRAAIPWSLIGPGWTLDEFSTAQPNANGQAASGGSISTYLVDPNGGRYLIRTWPGGATPALLAWSGNGESALYGTSSGTAGGGTWSYSLLTLTNGQVTNLPLPAGVTAVGFTRPDGLNILAVHQGQAKLKLQRYNLAGAYQATLATLPRRSAQQSWQFAICGSGCGAFSSPDGTTAVWGIIGDEMQLVSNAGGLIRKLPVPGSGKPSSCAPISWWNTDTVLANCAATGSANSAARLWLVPDSGSTPTPLTAASGSPSGAGFISGAWPAGGQVYVTSTTFTQCPTAASGPGGLAILRLATNGSTTQLSVANSTNHYSSVVAGVGGRLLVVAQTSCPGTSSLMLLDPSTGTTQTLLAAPSTEVGVIAAVPFGWGPAAVTDGLY
jgi:hypothetical protein